MGNAAVRPPSQLPSPRSSSAALVSRCPSCLIPASCHCVQVAHSSWYTGGGADQLLNTQDSGARTSEFNLESETHPNNEHPVGVFPTSVCVYPSREFLLYSVLLLEVSTHTPPPRLQSFLPSHDSAHPPSSKVSCNGEATVFNDRWRHPVTTAHALECHPFLPSFS